MARELDEGELSRLEEDAASSRAESESGFTGSGSAYSDEGVRRESSLTYKGESKRDALSILLRLADALEDNGGNEAAQDDYYDDAMDSQLLHSSRGKEVSYDLLDTYPGGPYKSRGGSIKKTRFVEEEEEDEDDDDDDQDQVFPAEPFNAEMDRLEDQGRGGWRGSQAKPALLPKDVEKGNTTFRRYKQRTRWNIWGSMLMVFYTLAFSFYMWVRITKTLDLGQFLGYGIFVLIVEIMGATSTISYGINLIWSPINSPLAEDPANPGLPKVNLPYHIRVLVPCYKESFDIVTRTIMAALDAPLPAGCSRTVYLCDDGKNKQKRKWCLGRAPEVVYVSGRQRPKGEMNGKSANLNNCLRQVYPENTPIPANEIVCIFDADQVANPDFFLKMVPLMDGGDDVGMVLSPQSFHNLQPHADIFNHANVQFWEYAQHGYDALDFISCTGTNFLIRSAAFREAGWSPEYTLTEDYALGMVLKMNKWKCRYVEEYLAVGEAPEEVRNCFQQRSRWTKGHFQIMFSRQHCPLLQRRLSLFMRLMYCSGVWSYVVGALTTPTYILIPVLTVYAGIFPIVVSWWAAVGLTIYMVAQQLVLNYCRKLRHFESLYFASVANNILWWTFVKACFNVVWGLIGGKKISFKATAKGVQRVGEIAMRDIWIHGAVFILLLATLCVGLQKLLSGPTVITTLSISVVWIIYAMVPPFLLLWYTIVGRGSTLRLWSMVTMLATYASAVLALLLLWNVYPKDFDYGAAAGNGLLFYNANAVGQLPANNPIPWRGNALLYEKAPKLGFEDLTGGWLQGGVAGDLKLTMPTAFTVSMLAWGALAFPSGYQKARQMPHVLQTMRWGSDYLLKTWKPDTLGPRSAGYLIIYQVGNLTTDVTWWNRPEAMTEDNMKRPAYAINTRTGASDIAGSMVGAFVSTAMAWQKYGNDTVYVDELMKAAKELYAEARKYQGSFGSHFRYTCTSQFAKARTTPKGRSLPVCVPPTAYANGSALVFYNSTSYRDDMVWAAAWMYKATGDRVYLDDVNKFYAEHITYEGGSDQNLVTDWDHMWWAANVLLAEATDQGTFHQAVQGMLKQWICATTGKVLFTPKGRAFNRYAPSLGSTASTAFLSLLYGQSHSRYIDQAKSERYTCFARSQLRYMLGGDRDRSLFAGMGKNPPTHVQNRAASCPDAPAPCNLANGLLSRDGNPHTLTGALVEFPSFSDTLQDVRTSNDTRVTIDNNAAAISALAGLNEASGSWDQCLQGFGVLTHDKAVCDASQL
ncbi:g11593 [Coccomyxa viridis]|uniref:cellulase n=1 Tax=Coccomyxa viridis TaxID=1274662 RepID=A0ABP1G897_9CHLO